MSLHLTYYECPYVGCNWWAVVDTDMQGRGALVEHVRDVHSPSPGPLRPNSTLSAVRKRQRQADESASPPTERTPDR